MPYECYFFSIFPFFLPFTGTPDLCTQIQSVRTNKGKRNKHREVATGYKTLENTQTHADKLQGTNKYTGLVIEAGEVDGRGTAPLAHQSGCSLRTDALSIARK